MWGIHPAQFGNAALKRITPTYVGNTPCHRLIYPLYKDHPHVCGEYNHRTISFGPSLGSPPRMWGILRDVDGILEENGITPTYVGNTTEPLH